MKIIFIFASFLLCINSIYGYVFINSHPMNADVYLNGELVGKTPFLIREKLSGNQRVRLEKTGHFDHNLTLNVTSDVTNVFAFLAPFVFSVYFPDQQTVTIQNRTFDNERIRNIPEGFYYFKTEPEGLTMRRRYPNEAFFWVSLGLGIVGIGSGIYATIQADARYKSFQESSTYQDAVQELRLTAMYDALQVAGYSIGGLGILGSLYFGIDRSSYNRKARNIQAESEAFREADITLYEEAMDLYSQGNDSAAFASFSSLIEQFPQSRFVPISLLRRSSIYYSQGKLREAINDLELIRNSYPLFEIYERAIKLLADYYREAGELDRAIVNYREIADIANTYPKSQAEYLLIKVLFSKYEMNKSDELKIELSSLIQNYVANDSYPQNFRNELRNLNLN
jgi:tetratricopeptide (TPR) repeat protein